MQILDNLIILSLIVLAFIAGKTIADRYNAARIRELEYQIRVLSARDGIGYIAYPNLKTRRNPIGQPFMDRLKDTGRAVQKIDPQQP